MKHPARKPAPRQKFDPAVRDFFDTVAEIITAQLVREHQERRRVLNKEVPRGAE